MSWTKRFRPRGRYPDRALSTSPTSGCGGCSRSIARRYDFLNHLLSLNIDRYWRTFTTRVAAPEPGARPRLLHRNGGPGPGLRPRRPGAIADRRHRLLPRDARPGPRQGSRRRTRPARITLVESDAQRLPLPSDTLQRRERGLRPAQRGRHGPRHRRDDSRRPARRQGRDPGVFPPRGAVPGRPLPDVLPPSAAADRPGDRPERRPRLRLPAPRACWLSRTARRCSTSWPRAG